MIAIMLACALSTKRQFLAQVTNPHAFVNASYVEPASSIAQVEIFGPVLVTANRLHGCMTQRGVAGAGR
jgi:hypothetical protein